MLSRRDILALPAALLSLSTRARAAARYSWRNVAIGGGGYVTGIAIHPAVPDLIYIRTDVGGPYRWDPDQDCWLPLFDFLTEPDRNLVGIESLALDPNDPERVWVSAGSYDYTAPCDVMLSTDRGVTWKRTGLNVRTGGNQGHRMSGERLAVDPSDGARVLCGSRSEGLWITEDSGATWVRLESVPAGTAGTGVVFVLFGREGLVYAGIAGAGIYSSRDAGRTWTPIEAGPPLDLIPRRAALDAAGGLWVTYRSNPGTNGAVWRYAPDGWADVTPERGRNYNAITTHPATPERLIVAENRDGFNCRIWLTSDRGAAWQLLAALPQPDVPWWPGSWWASAVSSFAWDPHHPERVWYTDWYGVWRTPDIEQQPSTWLTRETGHETLVAFALCSPPSGTAALLSGSADVDGMRHEDLSSFPSRKHGTPPLQDTTSIDFCEADPSRMVRVGGNRDRTTLAGGTSADGGLTWTPFGSLPLANARNGRIAMSAEDPNRIVWVPMNEAPFRSSDGGVTWQAAQGAPRGAAGSQIWVWNQPLAADRVDGNRFYLYRSGTLFISDDGGLTWTAGPSLSNQSNAMVKTPPGRARDVWVSLDRSGLHRWTAGTPGFVAVPRVTRAAQFGFGLGAAPDLPAVYVRGAVDGEPGIYRSDDLGETWISIGEGMGFATANTLEGDRQVRGRVYIGTNGRGIFYGEPVNDSTSDSGAARRRR